jgi:hypothetical protein
MKYPTFCLPLQLATTKPHTITTTAAASLAAPAKTFFLSIFFLIFNFSILFIDGWATCFPRLKIYYSLPFFVITRSIQKNAT